MSTHDEQDFDRTLTETLEHSTQWEGSPHAMFHKIRHRLRPQPWYQRIRPVLTLSATVLSLILFLGIYHYSAVFAPAIPNVESPIISNVDALPTVNTEEKLRELVGDNNSMELSDLYSVARSEKSDSNAGYSTTNIQVEGVDEADIIKTDGTYLYQILGQEIVISKIYPDDEMKVVSRTIFPDSIYPQEIYLDEQRLTVVALDYSAHTSAQSAARMSLMFNPANTQIMVYDVTRREAPVKVRTVEVDGSPVSTRKIDSVIYLVTQKWLSRELLEDETTVFYRDSAKGEIQLEVGLDSICYFPDVRHDAYLTVLAFDVADGSKEANVDVYLGAGRNIFMSNEHLYVALEQWTEAGEMQDGKAQTLVHKFNVVGTDIRYQGMGLVSGSILNQFSMDEYDGYFRIATTDRGGEASNNVYILDQRMKVVGTLEGLAPGEQIYSVRFMGDKGYLVTFELIDPLFVIDLEDPANPRVLGELKIPGFSNYLHPLDETTLLGIGQDTDVANANGRPVVEEKGIKLAIFDVSDVRNPQELHVEIIGEAGSYSQALYNHKAVLFYDDVLALPVSLAKSGKIDFQGAVAYQISKEAGFSMLGKVTHHREGKPAGDDWHHRDVSRSLIIDNVFYTVSDQFIKANRFVQGLPKLSSLSLQ